MDNKFRKAILSNGCIVQLRNGDKCIYLENANNMCGKGDVFIDLNNGSFLNLECYDNELTCKGDISNYDIIKICNMNFVGDNFRKHIINKEDYWTAEREENEKEDLKEMIEEIIEKVDKIAATLKN